MHATVAFLLNYIQYVRAYLQNCIPYMYVHIHTYVCMFICMQISDDMGVICIYFLLHPLKGINM